MKNKLLEFVSDLVAIKSIAGNKDGLSKVLKFAISGLEKYTIETFESNGSKSVLIYNSKKRPKKFKIILNGHLDVIPGKESQFIPKLKGDRLYGMGSMDMKAGVACLISVFRDVADKVDYPLALQLVTDEEIGGFDGTKYQIDKGVNADFVIAGEPTNFDIVNKAKGVLWLKISSKGKTAHGAYPWRGENAIWKMNIFLNKLAKKFPNPKKQKWVTTVNLSNIGTDNEALNKVPDSCFVKLDIRFVPEDEKVILKNIKKELPAGFKLEVLANEAALNTSNKNDFIADIQKIGKKIIGKQIIIREAQGTSDARHYARIGCPGIEFGPVGGEIGSDKEWLDINSLDKYYEIIKEFLLSI